MLSKLMLPMRICTSPLLRLKTTQFSFRKMSDMIPPSQYDMPIPKKFHLSYALRVYWEIVPLVITTCISLTLCFLAIIWSCKHKVDVVFTPSSPRDYLSRTMNMHHPTIHKLRVINQRYEPWPEMQDVLDKMKAAEHKVMSRAMTCPQL